MPGRRGAVCPHCVWVFLLLDHGPCHTLQQTGGATPVRLCLLPLFPCLDIGGLTLLRRRHRNIRILLMIPVYCLVAWVGTFFYKHSVYYSVIGDCYEAFTISAFFALMCHYLAPDLHSQKEYFRGIAPQPWVWPVTWFQKCGGWRKIWRTPRSGLTWFNVRTTRGWGSDGTFANGCHPPRSYGYRSSSIASCGCS